MADPERIRQALAARVDNLVRADGEMTLPAVPGMIEEYTDKCVAAFAAMGRRFNTEERGHLRSVLEQAMAQAWEFSQRSSITIAYRSSSAGPLDYRVGVNLVTLEQAYDEWIANREPPLFGSEPDARVMALAAELTEPAEVLDVGAGTGRNALALARRGHRVDAIEPSAGFVETMRTEAQRESLSVRVIQSDAFSGDVFLRADYALIVVSGVVSEFRTAAQLRMLFELAARSLAPGGRLVFNTFLTREGYTPDDAAREFAQQSYACLFTRTEVSDAVAGLPLDLLSEESVHDYEKAHLPDGAWPPTGWYVNWVTGKDVFGLEPGDCPIDLRWLVYRKSAGAPGTIGG